MNPNDMWICLAVAVGLVESAFALSWYLCGVVRRLAPRWGLLDRPGGHKGHREPTPMGGGLIAALLFCGAQVAVGSLFTPAVLLVVVGALAGFLVHNHAPARLFMGDAGSNFLGFLLGALTVVGTFTREGFSPTGMLA